MKKALLAVLAAGVLATAGCAQADHERLDKVEVDGTSCVAVRDGLGRVRFVSCDWDGE